MLTTMAPPIDVNYLVRNMVEAAKPCTDGSRKTIFRSDFNLCV
jgi:hypothetical protein